VKTTQASKHIRSWLKKNDPRMAVADGKSLLNRELAKSGLTVDKLNRRQINVLLGATSAKSLDDLLTHLSMGDFDAAVVARALSPALPTLRSKARPSQTVPASGATVTPTIIIDGQRGLAYRFGKCCEPRAGTAVVGYLTLTRGVTVHAHDCANIKLSSKRRLLDVDWI
jgi:GTP pyrophosphokinase